MKSPPFVSLSEILPGRYLPGQERSWSSLLGQAFEDLKIRPNSRSTTRKASVCWAFQTLCLLDDSFRPACTSNSEGLPKRGKPP